MNILHKLLGAAVLSLMCACAGAQDKKSYSISCVAFYNLENLFDTIPGKNDREFTPDEPKRWTSQRYHEKLNRMAEVIAQIGDEYNGLAGPAVIGLSEMENRAVLEDLVNTPTLKPLGYKIVHYDSPDKRGVDVALLYRPELFRLTASKAVRFDVADRPDFRSRDQLVVSGVLAGETVHFVVNHWPSRSGGEKKSRPLRIAAGELSRRIADSLQRIDPKAKIIIMGDLNDDPIDKSITQGLGAKLSRKKLEPGDLYVAMYDLYKRGIGTLAYKDSWSLFDNFVVSEALVNAPQNELKLYKVKIFNRPFLLNPSGPYAGYPLRTYVGSTFQGGYSDHFPIYLFLTKEK